MTVPYQLVIDCSSPELVVPFWTAALHYVVAPPPSGFDSSDDLYCDVARHREPGNPHESVVPAPSPGAGTRLWDPT
jgi:hypothetical protein